MEPPYAGLKWAHYLRVMLLVPLDQGTQGNKRRKGISLIYIQVQTKGLAAWPEPQPNPICILIGDTLCVCLDLIVKKLLNFLFCFLSEMHSLFSCKDGFWVGRSSLKQWKNLAIQAQNFEHSEENTEISQRPRQSSPQSDIKEAITNGDDDVNGNDNGHSRDKKCEDNTEIDRDSRADIGVVKENLQAVKRKCVESGDSKEAKMSKCENTDIGAQIVNGDVQEGNEIEEIKKEKLEKDCEIKQKTFNDDIVCAEHGKFFKVYREL